jgi:non-specific serine/threonine protein kinase
VADKSNHNESQGPVRALYRWLTGAKTGPAAPPDEAGRVGAGVPVRIGRYAIARKIGEGGMGVVYAAHDDRLGRTIALKTMSAIARDEPARRRFWREARAAASVNHPNICQIYEVGEDAGELFMAMELLEGEALADRLGRGPMSVADAVPIGLGILTALSALHARGIVHRDLKPSNVFLTPHGVKLLDFGLASFDMTMEGAASAATRTQTGVVMGTPRYMAPEVVRGEPVDTRTDLFAAGAILFEMLSGRPAFAGRTAVEIVHSAMFEQPPALAGSPGVAAIDRVIRRALAKKPADRQSSADAMADELRRAGSADTDSRPVLAQALTRLVVLPFRVLRPDPESDFLAFSLPDAIATSLSGTGSMIVRSTAAAARFAGEAPDLKALAADADVDRVVLGTLMRSGDQLRATAQLVEAPSGTLVTSHTVQSSMGDLFRLQDDIASRIVEALSLPLGSRTPPPSQRDVPHDPRAYELYLRANELARSSRRAICTSSAWTSIPPSRPPGPGSAAAGGSSASSSIRRPTATRRPSRPSSARSTSIPGCRWRTSSTRTSRPRRVIHSARSSACWARRPATAPTRSCSRVWCTRAGIAACSTNRRPRTRKAGASIPTSRPASSRRCC